MGDGSPKISSKKQKSDQTPESLRQAFVQVIWRSRWRTVYLIVAALLIAVFSIWTTLPESSKQHVLRQIALDSRGQQESLSNDQSKLTSHPTSLASVNRAKLRFGLSLGWQLARFEFVDKFPFPEAQAVAPTIKKDIADLLSADGFPNPIAELGYRDLIKVVLTYYGTTDIEKHSAILVGVATFRTSLVGAYKDETHNLAMRQLAFSAIQDIDPRTLPRKLEFFERLMQKQPGNIAELIGFIDSFYRE